CRDRRPVRRDQGAVRRLPADRLRHARRRDPLCEQPHRVQRHGRDPPAASVGVIYRLTELPASMLPRFALLLLDLDGTLVDSEAMLVGRVNERLAAHDLPVAPQRSVAATIGLPLEEVFRRALAPVHAGRIASLCAHYRTRADAAAFVSRFRLFGGVAATLGE